MLKTILAIWHWILSKMNSFTHDPVERREELLGEVVTKREQAQTKIRDLSRYSWVTVGFNRHERRAMQAELCRIDRFSPRGIFLRHQLRSSPENVPAKRGQTNNPMYWNVRRPNEAVTTP